MHRANGHFWWWGCTDRVHTLVPGGVMCMDDPLYIWTTAKLHGLEKVHITIIVMDTNENVIITPTFLGSDGRVVKPRP